MKKKWKLNTRRFERTSEERWHKARMPGAIRQSRLPSGSGFRNNWEWSNPGMKAATMENVDVEA